MFDKLRKRMIGSTGRKSPIDEYSAETSEGAKAETQTGIKPNHENLDSEAGIRQLGHREHIGGRWKEIGKLQFDFIVAQGLQPHHYYLDIACGSLRGGVHFIPYLDPGHYLGIDKEKMLIDLGIEHELGDEIVEQKKPRFVVSSEFEFSQFGVAPDFALAQSLFTHIPQQQIEKCLTRLRASIAPNGIFFTTFNETERASTNPSQAHDWGHFRYTRAEMEEFGRRCGWELEYIGDWNHPRNQRMVKYLPH